MAKKKSFLGSLVTLGGLAAVTVAAYRRREELKQLLKDTVERYFPDDEDEEVCDETEIIIDITGTVHTDRDEETVEETGED